MEKIYSLHVSPKNLVHSMFLFPHGNLVPFSQKRFLPRENSFLPKEQPSLGLPLSPFLHREGPFLLVEVDPKELSWAYHLVSFSLRKLLLTELGWDYHLILFFMRRNLPQQQLPWRSYPWVFLILNSYIWFVKEKENLGKGLNLEPSSRRGNL